MFEWGITNIVAKAKLSEELDLNEICGMLIEEDLNVKYNGCFPAVRLKLGNKKCRHSILIFSSGSLILSGNKTEEEIKGSIDYLVNVLNLHGKNLRVISSEITNIVTCGSFYRKLDLPKLCFYIENSEYDPLLFPGLVVRLINPKVGGLIFGCGSVIIAGIQNKGDIESAYQQLDEIVMKAEGEILNAKNEG